MLTVFRLALTFYLVIYNSSFASVSGTGIWCEYTVSSGDNYFEGYYFTTADVLFFDSAPEKQPRLKKNYRLAEDRISWKADNQLKWGRYNFQRNSLTIQRAGRYPDILATGKCENASIQQIKKNAEALRKQDRPKIR